MEVYYFSRTGRSEKIAEDIALKYNSKANKIDDMIDWSGKTKFIKAGAMAAKKELISIRYNDITDKEIILVFPIWAGTLPPAIRSFVNENKGIDMTVVTTSAMSSLKEEEKQIFKKVYEVKGKDNTAPNI